MYVITNTDEKYSLKKIEQRKCILISQTLWNHSVFGLCSFVFICLFWHVNGPADGLVFWYNISAWSFSWLLEKVSSQSDHLLSAVLSHWGKAKGRLRLDRRQANLWNMPPVTSTSRQKVSWSELQKRAKIWGHELAALPKEQKNTLPKVFSDCQLILMGHKMTGHFKY